MNIRIEGISSDPCSYAWYFGDVTLFLSGLIVGAAVIILWRLISRSRTIGPARFAPGLVRHDA